MHEATLHLKASEKDIRAKSYKSVTQYYLFLDFKFCERKAKPYLIKDTIILDLCTSPQK